MVDSRLDGSFYAAGPRDGVEVRDFCPDAVDAGTRQHPPPSRPLNMAPPTRQDRKVLGPHAFEDQMPLWMKQLIKEKNGIMKTIQYGPEPEITLVIMSNESYNTIPALQLLSAADPNVRSFVYCHPATNHVHKQPQLNGFCGYHSISMVLTYLRGCSTAPKHHVYSARIPNILELQDLIEEGWEQGINTRARIETGGLRGTRKYIGTSEAETVLRMLNTPCWTVQLKTNRGVEACDVLISHVEKYFAFQSTDDNPLGKPPIYLQYPGHSVVIVGFETWKKRMTYDKTFGLVDMQHLSELVVFDCSVSTHDGIRMIRDGRIPRDQVKKHLPAMTNFRVSRYELQRYGTLEIVFLQDPELFL